MQKTEGKKKKFKKLWLKTRKVQGREHFTNYYFLQCLGTKFKKAYISD